MRSLIGRPLGVLAARHQRTAVLADSGTGIDFALGGLGFKLAITDRRPYERATAQFRKEQFDMAPTPGDQSLSGWWTRGQLSFHKGAGVKFYEVLDGEDVLSRFADSSNVVWRKPGEVSLQEDTYPLQTVGSRSIWFPPILIESSYYWITGSSLQQTHNVAQNLAPVTPVGVAVASGTPRLICRGRGKTFYVATDANTIERYTHTSSTTPPTAEGVFYTHSVNLVGMWWAKNRLWVIDAAGAIFMLAGDPATKPEALGAPDTSLGVAITGSQARFYMSFTEAPNGVYLSDGSLNVWHIGVEQSETPTPGAPRVVAELPGGELCIGLKYHLGHVVMVGMTGAVRVAQVGNDGSLMYGPEVLRMGEQSWCRSMAAGDTSVFFTGPPMDASGDRWYERAVVYEVNLAQPLESALAFAAAPVLEYDTYDSSLPTGVLFASVDGQGFQVWGYGEGVTRSKVKVPGKRAAERIPEGSVTTGFHRFGTLEPKQFHSVKVRIGGNGGRVLVSRVMADGSTVSLLTVNTTQGDSHDITLGLVEPQEMVGLKFTLYRDDVDPTRGPTLLGYQLRAMPAPRRQRMIRVPLQLFDVEGGGPARASGRNGEAWRRLRTLESLEERNAMVVFQDFRTGEQGVCFIESIEHAGMTPPGHGDNGFGGVVMVTIRKVDGA